MANRQGATAESVRGKDSDEEKGSCLLNNFKLSNNASYTAHLLAGTMDGRQDNPIFKVCASRWDTNKRRGQSDSNWPRRGAPGGYI
jgi:hypothetical protein